MSRMYGTAGDDVRNFSDLPGGIEYFTRGGNDIVIGTSDRDIFHAEGGYWDNFRNIFFGGAGDDVFYGGEGRSTFVGGTGADTFIGGFGVDTLSYEHSWAGVRIDLQNNLFSGGEASGDKIIINDPAAIIENVIGSDHADIIYGNDADNTLIGGSGNDQLYGGLGYNVLDGGVGDDFFGLNGRIDHVKGGIGIDTVSYMLETQGVRVDLETKINDWGARGDKLESIENVTGTRFYDTLSGDDGANILNGGLGGDLLNGRGGADTLIGDGKAIATYFDSPGAVTIDLATGRGYRSDAEGDRLSGIWKVVGSKHADVIAGSSRAERLDGGAGDDVLKSGGGKDYIDGGAGADIIHSSDQGGTFAGGEGNDTFQKVGDNRYVDGTGYLTYATSYFFGGAGFDTIRYDLAEEGVRVELNNGVGRLGANGDHYASIECVIGSKFSDYIVGGDGSQYLSGGAGADTLVGGGGADTLVGGAGFDTVSYFNAPSAVSVDLNTGRGTLGDAKGDTYSGIERVDGSNWNDIIRGSNRDEYLSGGNGNDTLIADRFSDGLTKGGNDVLVGGLGADKMWGGGGSDRFVFATLSDSGKVMSAADLIYDFTRGDLLDFSQIDARVDVGGDQAFAYVGSNLFTGSGQIRSWNDGMDTYVAVNATGDHMPEMLVVLSGVVPLTSIDFVL